MIIKCPEGHAVNLTYLVSVTPVYFNKLKIYFSIDMVDKS